MKLIRLYDSVINETTLYPILKILLIMYFSRFKWNIVYIITRRHC